MNEEARQWIAKALEDLHVAEHEMALPPGERILTAICFHSQQFVEKMLKAFLIAHGRQFPRTHNLSFLKALCGEIDPDFDSLPIDELSLYAVELRYPGEPLQITSEEAADCFQKAMAFRRFIEEKLGMRLEQGDKDEGA